MPCITSYLSNAAQCSCKQGKEWICGEKERKKEREKEGGLPRGSKQMQRRRCNRVYFSLEREKHGAVLYRASYHAGFRPFEALVLFICLRVLFALSRAAAAAVVVVKQGDALSRKEPRSSVEDRLLSRRVKKDCTRSSRQWSIFLPRYDISAYIQF